MKSLVIVESPTKARTIGKFLGPDYTIKASMGHVIDLPKSKIGIDFEHGFAPLYEMVEDKKQIIADLKSSAKSADSIILATDPDREGEAIAAHIAELLTKNTNSIREHSQKNSRELAMQRIVFHEITKEAIEEALKNPRSIDKNLVDAQTARRVLDRLVGYKLSPILWKKIRRGLSAGRVQSVALRLIVEREREIEKFGKEKYWTISAFLSRQPRVSDDAQDDRGPVAGFPPTHLRQDYGGQASASAALPLEAFKRSGVGIPSTRTTPRSDSTEFELIEINGDLPAMQDGKALQAGKIEVAETFDLYDGQYKTTKTSIDSEEKAKKIVADLQTKTFTVSDVLQKETRRSPAAPYTTSTLQQDAARRLYMNGKRTMSLAQKLYEEGFITYHRTDSVTISNAALFSIRNFVEKSFGARYIPGKPRFYKTKQKLAQEAHEAIRPTILSNQPLTINKQLGRDYGRLYELIWERTVASQMSDAIMESTTVLVDTIDVIPNSFRDLLPTGRPLHDSKEMLKHPPALAFGQNRWRAGVQHDKGEYRLKATGSVLVFDGFLKVNPLGLLDNRLPQFKVSERLSLIDVSEKEHETLPPPRYNDASIIKTLEEKGIGRPSTYATIISTIESRQYILREEGRFSPTAIGIAVNDFLVANFKDIDDIPFTALMEDSLDEIAHGKKQWEVLMKDFYTPFEKKLHEVEGAERIQIAVEETDEKCPQCKKGNLIIRTGKFGKFLACSTFPDCKFTKAFVEKTDLKCPKDRGEIVIKKTRKGRKFYGCSNYPKCDFASWTLPKMSS